MSDLVIITAMILSAIVFLATFFGVNAFRDERKTKDGSYGLSAAKNKAKAAIVENETTLKLNAARTEPGYENVHVQKETRK